MAVRELSEAMHNLRHPARAPGPARERGVRRRCCRHRRRHSRRRPGAGRRRRRPLGVAARADRDRGRILQSFEQTDPRRTALPRDRTIAPGARESARARPRSSRPSWCGCSASTSRFIKHTRRRPWELRLGLSLYALLAGLGRGARFGKRAASPVGPRSMAWIRQELQAVFCYHDAQTDDQALDRRGGCARPRRSAPRFICPAQFTGAALFEDGADVRFSNRRAASNSVGRAC